MWKIVFIILAFFILWWGICYYGAPAHESGVAVSIWPTDFGSGCVKIWDYIWGWYTQTSDDSIRGRADKIFYETNEERIKEGFTPLIRDPRLDELAQEHAKSMYNRGDLDHYGFDGRANAAIRLGYNTAGENAAFDSTGGYVSGWLNSSGHRFNIFIFSHVGIGVYGAYAVQFFASY